MSEAETAFEKWLDSLGSGRIVLDRESALAGFLAGSKATLDRVKVIIRRVDEQTEFIQVGDACRSIEEAIDKMKGEG